MSLRFVSFLFFFLFFIEFNISIYFVFVVVAVAVAQSANDQINIFLTIWRWKIQSKTKLHKRQKKKQLNDMNCLIAKTLHLNLLVCSKYDDSPIIMFILSTISYLPFHWKWNSFDLKTHLKMVILHIFSTKGKFHLKVNSTLTLFI